MKFISPTSTGKNVEIVDAMTEVRTPIPPLVCVNNGFVIFVYVPKKILIGKRYFPYIICVCEGQET